MAKDTPLLVAIDDGYAQTKLVGQSPDGEGLQSLVMRTSVRAGRYGLGSISGEQAIGAYETEEGDMFTISDDIPAENTQFDSFHTSSMNRALVTHALMLGGYGGRKVQLITGLPVADFFNNGAKDEAKIAEKAANLKKGISCVSTSDPLPVISDVRVGSQAVASFIDHVLDENLSPKRESDIDIAVVDIGGRTTDIAVVRRGKMVDHAFSGTANIGVLDVYKALTKQIQQHFQIRDEIALAELDRAVRSQKLRLWGKDEDISEIVASVVKEQESKIAREVERRIGSAANFSAVLFVGGGSALFKTVASQFRNGHMADDPEFANSRGLMKFAVLNQESVAA